jgi:hypothetical protein
MAPVRVYPLALAFCAACSVVHAQERPRRALLLYSYDNMTPANATAGAAVRKRLEQRSPGKTEFYVDLLDLARFRTETDELFTLTGAGVAAAIGEARAPALW